MNSAVRQLRRVFGGDVILDGDAAYEQAREIWNAAIEKRPAIIARCRTAGDIRTAIQVAANEGVEVSVRCGGHNIAGTSLCDGGMMLDLSRLKDVRVDPAARTAVTGPGLLWADLDAATTAYGLAIPGGVVPATGVSGLTLGGGYGWLSRMHGWTCDNLLAATVLTASGELVEASADGNADLLWGLRGGGGTFGVVTSFTFQLHPVERVLAGSLVYGIDRARKVLQHARDAMVDAPDEVCLVIGLGPAPAAARMPADLAGRRVLRISVAGFGTGPQAQRFVSALTRAHKPDFSDVCPRPYISLQSMLEAGGARGLHHYSKSSFLRDLDDASIDTIVGCAEEAPGPLSRIVLHTLSGEIARRDDFDAAFGHRDAGVNLQIDAGWHPHEDAGEHIRWARVVWAATAPASTGGSYVNFLGADEGADGVRRAYGDRRLDRLQALKATLDPENFFRNNQNIPPAREVVVHEGA